MVCGHDNQSVVVRPRAVQAIEQLSEHQVDVTDLEKVTLVGLQSKERLPPFVRSRVMPRRGGCPERGPLPEGKYDQGP